ncbi:M48 family metalloprotease [Caulobacter sp. 17J80-11]|uniref:M48 family metalloprotease n=1 Tax=Caulobacter sp. 17J80-11 TaxID=2763502 RepID=UPI00165342BD|nr:M48 family metalloprotease [Caulobacter sp. 17J80-11]MBC6983237.1 M48 family metallopeptidase [Caulobacter sp. 17J80-11]
MISSKRASKLVAGLLMVGVALAAPAAQAMNMIRDTEIEEIIRKEANPVLTASGLNADDVDFYLVADKELNAFVTGGQNIFIHTGLIQETENPNQLLGVIAHEAGHISGGHMIRSGDMNRAGMKPFLLTMGLGVLAAALGAPDAAGALIGSSQYFGALGALNYSRVQEAAADQAGVAALEKAGLSGRGLVEFFDNFRYQEVFSEAKRYQFFRSHPLSSERIEGLRRRVEAQPHYDQTDSAEAMAAHALMKAKLDAFLSPPQQIFIKYSEKDTSFPARYARTIAYYQATEPEKALKSLDALLAEQPNNPYLWELKGQILFESARAGDAEPAHRRSVELKPDAPLLRINLAQTLLAENTPEKTEQAIQELGKALTAEKDNAFAWRLLSEAFDSKGMPGQARLAAAEYHYAVGELREARVFAMRAREHLEKNTPDWRRATDIVLVSDPSDDDLKTIAREDRGPSPSN